MVIYVNKEGLDSKSPPVKYGTIIVKENLNHGRELKAITIMYKIKDFNPSSGDWFWAKYSRGGEMFLFLENLRAVLLVIVLLREKIIYLFTILNKI